MISYKPKVKELFRHGSYFAQPTATGFYPSFAGIRSTSGALLPTGSATGATRTRRGPLSPVPELNPAKLAVVKRATRPLLEYVQETALHRVDLVPDFQPRHTVRAALVASAPATQMKAIGTRDRLQAVAFLAAVLRHEAQPLNEATMDPAQFTAAPAAFFHSPCYNPICVSVQSVRQ